MSGLVELEIIKDEDELIKMKKADVIKSTIATIIAGISIYGLKKREEKAFKKEYQDLQEKYQAELKGASEAYEAE